MVSVAQFVVCNSKQTFPDLGVTCRASGEPEERASHETLAWLF